MLSDDNLQKLTRSNGQSPLMNIVFSGQKETVGFVCLSSRPSKVVPRGCRNIAGQELLVQLFYNSCVRIFPGSSSPSGFFSS